MSRAYVYGYQVPDGKIEITDNEVVIRLPFKDENEAYKAFLELVGAWRRRQ